MRSLALWGTQTLLIGKLLFPRKGVSKSNLRDIRDTQLLQTRRPGLRHNDKLVFRGHEQILNFQSLLMWLFLEGTQMGDEPASGAELMELCSCRREGQWFSLLSVWPGWLRQQCKEWFILLCGSKTVLPTVLGRVWYSCSHLSRQEAEQGSHRKGRGQGRVRRNIS